MSCCPDEVRIAVAEILRTGLVRIRQAAGGADPALCFIEADHLHNLPTLLERYSDELLRFYLSVEREAYLNQLRRHKARNNSHHDVRVMQAPWSALERYAHARAAQGAR
jgi:hypothetical protein